MGRENYTIFYSILGKFTSLKTKAKKEKKKRIQNPKRKGDQNDQKGKTLIKISL
jgi:hypothetical protein